MLLFLLATAIVLALEWHIKDCIRRDADLPRTFCRGHIRVEHMENTGFSASRLKDRPEIAQLAGFFAAAAAFLTFIPELFRRKKDAVFHLGAGLLVGGSLANLLDRTFRGSVTDYLRFPTCPWKKIRALVFNAADLCIFAGTALVLLRSLFGKKK